MASRVEVAFGIPAQELLDLQSAYEAAQEKNKGAPANAKPYVAPFLNLKAVDIENWVNRNIGARLRFSVLLRTLIHSTVNDIIKIDFPGNDDAEQPGLDGFVECAQSSAWVPAGKSGWEFGVNQDIKAKADKDWAKSLKGISQVEREDMTFVFVTPRHWAGKDDWVKEKSKAALWRDVRAYDSSDLEQWLEQSIAAQTWFADEIGQNSQGVHSLDKCWMKWASVSNPQLPGSLFLPAIETAKQKIISKLEQLPAEPIVIGADSAEEALAFLAQIFSPNGGEKLSKYRARVLVFEETGVLPRLAQGAKDFIAVAVSRDVERELGPLSRTIHSIVVYPRNSATAQADIVLEPLSFEPFQSALSSVGIGRDDIVRLSNESGRSLTVLRRRLASVPAVKTPKWADAHETATHLIPFMFVGAWSSTNSADQSELARIGNTASYEVLEKHCQYLAGLDDAPLWSVATYRGCVSKIDLLFAIAWAITHQDLVRFFEAAKRVLGEDDPALDLPEDERWAATFKNKSREYSGALRKGISETLVLLAVHGNHLFLSRIGFDCEMEVSRLVRDLLTPLKTRILEANDTDLTAYAEAAPDVFLSILEEDLKSDIPECFGLLKPASSGLWGGGTSRTGLLWALEGLAWSSTTLTRAALVLARLAEVEINDNWVNKPINSLKSIFSSWMPQTAVDLTTRVKVLGTLAEKFPKAAWAICIDQIDSGHRTGHYNHKPSWRNDANGFGEPLPKWGPIHEFVRAVVSMLLQWKQGYTCSQLCDLVGVLHSLSKEHQTSVWKLIEEWIEAGATDADKAIVREKIRVTVLSRWGAMRSKKGDFAVLSKAAKVAYQSLAPSDIFSKHDWLFKEYWVEESADELNEEVDYEAREKRVRDLRTEALREIYADSGLAGTIKLAKMGNASGEIGWLMTREILQDGARLEFLLAGLPLSSGSGGWSSETLLRGALSGLQSIEKCTEILNQAREVLEPGKFVELLLLAPFRRTTWRLVDELESQGQLDYWMKISPSLIFDSNEENHEAVERLLSVKRPRAAFSVIHFKLETIEPELLFRVMEEMLKDGNDEPGHYKLEEYYVETAFKLIDKALGVTTEQKARLEYAFIDALSKTWKRKDSYGIPNLERYVESHPELFVQAIVWTYRRKDEQPDPPEWHQDGDSSANRAERGYKLLDALKRVPGYDHEGILQSEILKRWIQKVRDSCAELGRLDIADLCIGKLLAHSPIGADGIWPVEATRDVLEAFHSKAMMDGAHNGIYNLRGVHWRGEGGDQERKLAEKYRTWANALQYTHPYTAAELLNQIANTYSHEAKSEDTRALVGRRLR